VADPKAPVVLDVEKWRDLMTEDGYEKFVALLRDIGSRKENTMLMNGDKPICVFIPGWKLGKAIEGLALEP